jgi:hypothetical protein
MEVAVGGGWRHWFKSLVCLDSRSESSGEELPRL